MQLVSLVDIIRPLLCNLFFVKGSPISKALVFKNLPVQIKMAILSRRLILLAILLYEQFIHYT